MGKPLRQFLPALLSALLLSACGGGDSNDSNGSGGASVASADVPQSQVAADGLARFNYWRGQLGLQALSRNIQLDTAAQNHSEYQALNDQITHNEVEGQPGFTGVCLIYNARDPNCGPTQVTRLQAAHYSLQSSTTYAAGEVISQTSYADGTAAADELIAAIYYRFVIFEPMFKEVGTGAATSASGRTYFTGDFAALGLDSGIGFGKVVTFPKDGQKDVPLSFSSNSEIPDPVPSKDVVGYPVSVHADIIYSLIVSNFTIAPEGGVQLPVQQIWSAIDPLTRESEAAIVPLNPLQAATTYNVEFRGTMILKGENNTVVESVPINANWSFKTQ